MVWILKSEKCNYLEMCVFATGMGNVKHCLVDHDVELIFATITCKHAMINDAKQGLCFQECSY